MDTDRVPMAATGTESEVFKVAEGHTLMIPLLTIFPKHITID